jgi:hypothetical protein
VELNIRATFAGDVLLSSEPEATWIGVQLHLNPTMDV